MKALPCSAIRLSRRVSCALLALAGMAGPLRAEPMTFDQAIARAGMSAPAIQARQQQVDAARLARIAAPQLPDPKLEVAIQDFPITGPNAFAPQKEDFSMLRVGVTQDVPNAAKRDARRGRAEADIVAAQAESDVERRNVAIAAGVAWINLYYAQRQLAALDDADKEIDRLETTLGGRLASGSARPSQALQPAQLKAEVGDRRAALLAEAGKARAALTQWTGDASPDVAGKPPLMEVSRERLRSGLADLPSVRALGATADQAEADVRLARAEKKPDLSFNASIGKRFPRFGDLASVGVSHNLPLFAKKRQDPIIAARRLEADRARLEREAALREAAASLDADIIEHGMHHDRYARARDVLVPLAVRKVDLDRAGYVAGTIDLGTALIATIDLAKAQIDLFDREAEVARDAVRIMLTYGSINQ
jgi:cobalt-zinc-cadmium efflux system outer membrane protein